MNDFDDEKFGDELMARARQLETDIQPERDLWPEIAAAIAEPATPSVLPWNRYLAQVAAVVLLVGGSSGLTYLSVSGDGATTPAIPVTGLVFEPVSGSFGSQYMLGPDFQDARNVLESRLEQELEQMSPESRVVVEMNIASIRDVIVDINRALAKEPDNKLLQKLLLSSYQDELSVMRNVNGLTNSVMFREDI